MQNLENQNLKKQNPHLIISNLTYQNNIIPSNLSEEGNVYVEALFKPLQENNNTLFEKKQQQFTEIISNNEFLDRRAQIKNNSENPEITKIITLLGDKIFIAKGFQHIAPLKSSEIVNDRVCYEYGVTPPLLDKE